MAITNPYRFNKTLGRHCPQPQHDVEHLKNSRIGDNIVVGLGLIVNSHLLIEGPKQAELSNLTGTVPSKSSAFMNHHGIELCTPVEASALKGTKAHQQQAMISVSDSIAECRIHRAHIVTPAPGMVVAQGDNKRIARPPS